MLLLPSLLPSAGQTGWDGLPKQEHVLWIHHPLCYHPGFCSWKPLSLKNVNVCKTQDKLPLSLWMMDPMQNEGKKCISRSPGKSPRSWAVPSLPVLFWCCEIKCIKGNLSMNAAQTHSWGRPTNYRHSLPVTVEVQNGKNIVGPLRSQFTDGDCVLGPGKEGKAKVPGSAHQSAFIRRGRLVVELT